jgi:hypothetical protein
MNIDNKLRQLAKEIQDKVRNDFTEAIPRLQKEILEIRKQDAPLADKYEIALQKHLKQLSNKILWIK